MGLGRVSRECTLNRKFRALEVNTRRLSQAGGCSIWFWFGRALLRPLLRSGYCPDDPPAHAGGTDNALPHGRATAPLVARPPLRSGFCRRVTAPIICLTAARGKQKRLRIYASQTNVSSREEDRLRTQFFLECAANRDCPATIQDDAQHQKQPAVADRQHIEL